MGLVCPGQVTALGSTVGARKLEQARCRCRQRSNRALAGGSAARRTVKRDVQSAHVGEAGVYQHVGRGCMPPTRSWLKQAGGGDGALGVQDDFTRHVG